MRRILVMMFALMLVMAACTGGEEGSRDEATSISPTPLDPQTMLQDVVMKLRDLKTFRLLLEQTGAPYRFFVTLEVGGPNIGAVLRRGEAQYITPDLFGGEVSLKVDGLPTLSMILFAKGPDQWFRLATSPWFHFPFAEGFDPSALIQEDSGFQKALVDLKSLEYVGDETLIDGTETYHLRGVAGGANITDLLFGLLKTENDVIVDVYVDKSTGLPALLEVTQPETATDGQDPTKWRVEIYDVNGEETIEIPPAALESAEATPEATAEAE